MDTADGLKIEVKSDDLTTLTEIADVQYRTPAQQAAAFLHAALEATRARANAPEKPAKLGRAARDKPQDKAA